MNKSFLISPIILCLTSCVFASNVFHTNILIKNVTKSETIYATIKKVEKRYIIKSGEVRSVRLETSSTQIPIALGVIVPDKKPQNFYKEIICLNATLTVSKNIVGDYVVSLDESRC